MQKFYRFRKLKSPELNTTLPMTVSNLEVIRLTSSMQFTGYCQQHEKQMLPSIFIDLPQRANPNVAIYLYLSQQLYNVVTHPVQAFLNKRILFFSH